MDEARRKLRMWLAIAVTVAIIVGCIYYFHDVKGSADISEGTFVLWMAEAKG